MSEDVRKRVMRTVLDAGGDNVQTVGVYAVICLCNLRLDGVCVCGNFYRCIALDAFDALDVFDPKRGVEKVVCYIKAERGRRRKNRTGVSGSAACQPLLIIQPKST